MSEPPASPPPHPSGGWDDLASVRIRDRGTQKPERFQPYGLAVIWGGLCTVGAGGARMAQGGLEGSYGLGQIFGGMLAIWLLGWLAGWGAWKASGRSKLAGSIVLAIVMPVVAINGAVVNGMKQAALQQDQAIMQSAQKTFARLQQYATQPPPDLESVPSAVQLVMRDMDAAVAQTDGSRHAGYFRDLREVTASRVDSELRFLVVTKRLEDKLAAGPVRLMEAEALADIRGSLDDVDHRVERYAVEYRDWARQIEAVLEKPGVPAEVRRRGREDLARMVGPNTAAIRVVQEAMRTYTADIRRLLDYLDKNRGDWQPSPSGDQLEFKDNASLQTFRSLAHILEQSALRVEKASEALPKPAAG